MRHQATGTKAAVGCASMAVVFPGAVCALCGTPSRSRLGAALRALIHSCTGLACFALALWSKETAITLVAVLMVYDHARLARSRAWWRPTAGMLLRGSVLIALAAGYLRLRVSMMSDHSNASWDNASLSTSELVRACGVHAARYSLV